MSKKQLLFHSVAREKVLRGATALAKAVRVTLGPRSKSVLIGKRWGNPTVCNDGVTIARELELPDDEENLGARVLRQAAERTGDSVGDGTPSATLLAHAMFAAEEHQRLGPGHPGPQRPPSSAAAATTTPSRAASPSSAARSRTPPATTTARSSRSGWPSWSAGSR